MPGIPNIVVVLADDLAIWALGCYGNPEIRTPNIDQLAADGAQFTQFYCTSPVCSPSRASLLTGRMPSSHGVQDWIREGNGGPRDRAIDYLEGQRTYTETLAENGVTCGISGKWHLGDSPRRQKGYSHWFVHPSGGGSYNDVPMYRDGERVETSGYLTDVITEDAIGFIRSQAEAGVPFHASVNYTAPHSPWVDQHPQRLVDLYADCEFASCPQETRHPWISSHPIELDNSDRNAAHGRGTVTIRDHLQGYFASVTAIDEAVGRIRRVLEELGIAENTLLIFTSDNGFNCGHHGIWGKGNATFPQNMYDTSIKVPFIAAMPGRIPSGRVVDRMLSGYDFMPTILDVAGLADQVPAGLPGRSFADAMLDAEPHGEGDRAVVVFDEFGPTRMIRTGRWKYVHRYPYGPHELFDLVNDPGERVNLLADERAWEGGDDNRFERARALRVELERWFDRYSDPARDARSNAVSGRGQVDLVGQPGVEAFHPLETRKTFDDPSFVASAGGSVDAEAGAR